MIRDFLLTALLMCVAAPFIVAVGSAISLVVNQ